MIRRRNLRTRAIKMLVLDEADEMLNKGRSKAGCQTHVAVRGQLISAPLCCPGFKEQIYDVYRYLPPATQVVLISATLPHEILEMTNKFMTDPIRILVKRSVCRAHSALLRWGLFGGCEERSRKVPGPPRLQPRVSPVTSALITAVT